MEIDVSLTLRNNFFLFILRALRVIYLDKISSYEDLLKRANLDTLNERRLKDILFLMYQMVPGYYENIVKRNDLKPSSL